MDSHLHRPAALRRGCRSTRPESFRLRTTERSAYDCAGVSTRQHNEPAGNQDVWHFHQHLFPRYPGDDLYGSLPQTDWLPADRRRAYAERLRAALNS